MPMNDMRECALQELMSNPLIKDMENKREIAEKALDDYMKMVEEHELNGEPTCEPKGLF